MSTTRHPKTQPASVTVASPTQPVQPPEVFDSWLKTVYTLIDASMERRKKAFNSMLSKG